MYVCLVFLESRLICCHINCVLCVVQRSETTDAQMQARIGKLAEQALERSVHFLVFLCQVSAAVCLRSCKFRSKYKNV